jgi:hemolysin III
MIYVLIAGSYTPLSLLVLNGAVGWTIFGVSWAMAATGIVIKLFHTGKYNKISTAMYVFMGWVIVFAIKPLIANLSSEGLAWLFAGGVSYTVGALFYSIRKMPYGHATFHIFTLLGSACHFVCVYFFVLE